MIQTVAQLLDAAAREGLALTTERDELDAMGLDFLTLQARDVGGVTWIVRTPRRPDVVEAARGEARALALVRPRLPVAVPDWQIHADDVIAYPRLDGTPAITMDGGAPVWHHVDPAAPSATFLDSFAAALAALLAIPVEEARAAGVPVRTLDDERARFARAFELTREALAPSEALWARWHRWLDDDALWPAHLAVSHGNLHPGHLLLDDSGRLLGILDWTEAAVGDPSIDLAMFLGCFGRPSLEALVPRLEALGVRTWPRVVDHAAERWIASPALGAEWALRTGSEVAMEFSRAMVAASG